MLSKGMRAIMHMLGVFEFLLNYAFKNHFLYSGFLPGSAVSSPLGM